MNLTYLGKVYETYGMAAQMAQMLEKELALLILIPSMTAKGTPTPELMSSTIADLDTLPLGRLKGKLKNYATLGDSFSKLLDEANVERKFLTHHFFDHYQDVIDTEAGQKEMIQRLEKIRDLLHDSYLRVSKASLDSFTTLWGIPKEKVQEDIKSIEAQKNKNS